MISKNKLGLFILTSIMSIQNVHAVVGAGVVLNPSRESTFDHSASVNFEDPTLEEEKLPARILQNNELLNEIVNKNYVAPWESVMAKLPRELENETDYIYLINTSEQRLSCNTADRNLSFISPQHMLLIRRKGNGPLFRRDNLGQISNLNFENIELATLAKTQGNQERTPNYNVAPRFLNANQIEYIRDTEIPVTSGRPAAGGILTFSGIFRVNEERTMSRAGHTNYNLGMHHIVYFDGVYDRDNQESGVAIHGTPPKFYGLLGKSRGSHGCARVRSEFAQWNRSLLFQSTSGGGLFPRSEIMGDVHVWNRKAHFPDQNINSLKKENRLKVLIITFDGYASSCS